MSHTDSILIVDDDPRFCDSLKVLLNNEGYEMQTSNSGSEAVECLAKNNFDLVLLDILLPDMNGHQIMDYINSQSPETLVIVLTGHASVESAVESLRRGAYDYLRKPFEPEELLTTVKNALDQQRFKKDSEMAKGALKESEERYRTLVQNAPIGIYRTTLGPKGRFLMANPTFLKMFGLESEEELKKIAVADVYMNPKDRKAFSDNLLAQGSATEVELPLRKKDGTTFWGSVTAKVMYDEGGKAPCFDCTIMDISARKQAEEEQEKLEAQLQAAQRMESLGTLAGGIAHDFNNLLMGIQGNASLMLLDKTSDHPDCDRLKNIEQSVRSGAELTKQLLCFARGGKYDVKPTDLNELIENQNRMFGHTNKEITIRGRYEDNLWTVEVDRGQIQQVMLNLYVNSWQSMPGGGYLYIQTENLTIDENFSKPYQMKPGRYVKISVADTGIGMNEATQQRIFEPFFTTKGTGRGTGLGLASVYGIIRNHGGIITVYSEKGKGTTFTIYLPASEKEVIEDKDLAEEVLTGTETVLLVDDEDMVIDVGEQVLKELGYKVLSARSGKEAIELYEANKDKIDIVILDMIMPEMGGGETYDGMKEINPDTKVLLSSGYSIDGQATEILERGCDGFIQKPFDVKQLSKNIRKILDKK
jgi:two-component system cell cycle sensor histidine kinase/response regulator CckA